VVDSEVWMLVSQSLMVQVEEKHITIIIIIAQTWLAG